jgi:hypothetical protein
MSKLLTLPPFISRSTITVTFIAILTLVAPLSQTFAIDTVWFDDALPPGSTAIAGRDGWNWVSSNPAAFAGTFAHRSALRLGRHAHGFSTTSGFSVDVGDTLVAYVFLDPGHPPREIMLAWSTGTRTRRAYWGANLIDLGKDGTASRRYMGGLPLTGKWVRLEVPASLVRLERHTVTGMMFHHYDGRATWDYVGKSPAPSLLRLSLNSLPENEWRRVNVNLFVDVWTPMVQRPQPPGVVAGSPRSIIEAWSSMAWDSNRGDLIFWGGGHANYPGNDVYRWRSSTLQWERASLPSEVINVGSERYEAVDGVDNAPTASHTYDNSEFLAIADRFVTFGGAAYNTGAAFVRSDGITQTGPYFWNPASADANKVGGSIGSHVNPALFPSIEGGEMWENRRMDSHAGGGPHPGDTQYGFLNGATGYVQENGKDVLYICETNLWRYVVNDVNDRSQDTYERVGIYWEEFSGMGAGAVDPVRRLFVRTAGPTFTYWDLNQASPWNRNRNFVPIDASGTFPFLELGIFGMDYDPIRQVFVLWDGNAAVWLLTPPAVPSPEGWTLTRAPGPTLPDLPHRSDGGSWFSGILGKWKYVPNHDVYVGVIDPGRGDVWVYKPSNWQPPH